MPADDSHIWISVILPCRNAAAVIEHQLRALATQCSTRPWEVIVVDNNSTDNTRDIAEQWTGRLPRFRIIEARERQCAAYARNAGVAASTGQNVAFCDADDEVAPGWLAALEVALVAHEAVACRAEDGKLNTSHAARARRIRQREGLQTYEYPPYLPFSGGGQIAVRRWIFDRLGGFDEGMLACEDADFCWRLQLAGHELHFAGDAVVHMRMRENLWGMCRQARVWGEWNVVLYKKFRPHGMPELSRAPGLRKIAGLVRRSPHLLDRERRPAWLWQASWATGRVIGSVKHKIWALSVALWCIV